MPTLAERYAIPTEIMEFVSSGFLVLLSERAGEVEFHIPSRRHSDRHGEIVTYSVRWTHPANHTELCHNSGENLDELPCFEAEEDDGDHGPAAADIETLDDLIDWLTKLQDWQLTGVVRH
jgi:hypothetical protein